VKEFATAFLTSLAVIGLYELTGWILRQTLGFCQSAKHGSKCKCRR
jgi:hypothetical protein